MQKVNVRECAGEMFMKLSNLVIAANFTKFLEEEQKLQGSLLCAYLI